MNARIVSLFASAAIATSVAAGPAAAQQPVQPVAAAVPAPITVAGFYNRYRIAPIWFAAGQAKPATRTLIDILNRAPFDGFGSGPQLAAQVSAALAAAQTGDKNAIDLAERTLSEAWVLYVQTLKRPTQGMIYAYKVLEPQGVRPDQILLTAAAAPSLEQHLLQVSNLNPVYAQLRATAIAEAQAKGASAPEARLLANLDRARSIPSGGRFVLVDAAAQRLWMYENGVPIDSMKVIVGTNETPTPMIASFMHYVTLNPYWNAPDNLIRKAIAPNAASQGDAYLKSRGYEVMSGWGEDATVVPSSQVDWKAVQAGRQKIRVRQLPGNRNFMGEIKFPFPNGQDIYLHDTPTKSLFTNSQRALSNGCVRLEDASKLGRWLLGREPVSQTAEAEQHVQTPQGVPVIVTYLTAQPKDGKLTYLTDVYGWDKTPSLALSAATMVARD